MILHIIVLLQFNFGVGLRYYFWKTCSGGIAYQGEKYSRRDLLNYLQFNAGMDFFVSEKVFITPGIFYNLGLSDDAEYNYGLSIAIGLKF